MYLFYNTRNMGDLNHLWVFSIEFGGALDVEKTPEYYRILSNISDMVREKFSIDILNLPSYDRFNIFNTGVIQQMCIQRDRDEIIDSILFTLPISN